MSIKLNAQSGGSVALDAPTQTTSSADISLKLPVADGTNGQYLGTNGSGQLAFSTVQGVPVGAIIMWNSTIASIPSGWVLCDGSNGTPDLRDRYIIGAKQDDSGVAKTNISGSLEQTGGASQVTSGAGNAFGTAQNFVGGNALGVNNRGHGHPVTVIPPFFALVFIMKT